MYINKIYIENFGTLSKYSYEAATGFNQIIGDNGAGKTTLAVFIKCMFYGMPNSNRRKNIDDAIRKKYTPWQGGEYGGYLEFEIADGRYRVERTFGKKDSEDTYELIDLNTGKNTDRFSAKLGEEVFGVDEEAYGATAWIGSRNLELSLNDSIHARLGEYLGLDEDCGEYSLVYERLDDMRKNYIKTGRRGSIAVLEDRLSQIYEQKNIEKNNCSKLENEIAAYEKELSLCANNRADNTGAGSNKLDKLDKSKFKAGIIIMAAMTLVVLISAFGTGIYMGMISLKDYRDLVVMLAVFLTFSSVLMTLWLAYTYFTNKKNNDIFSHSSNLSEVKEDTELIRKREELNVKLQLARQQLIISKSKFDNLTGQAQGLLNDIEKQKYELKVIGKTMEYLEAAKQEYAGNYMSRLIEHTNGYLKKFDNELAMQIKIDEDYIPKLNIGVHSKELGYLSAGLRDIVWLCQRLALIDILYQKEKVCVILDDPFINLDDAMLEKAAQLVDTVSDSFQVIYFTCKKANSLDI